MNSTLPTLDKYKAYYTPLMEEDDPDVITETRKQKINLIADNFLQV